MDPIVSSATTGNGRPPRKWLILSHAFNMDGRAASLTITDKIPYLRALGIEPVVLSGVMGEHERSFPHHQLLPWGPAGIRFDLRHVIAKRFGRGALYRVATALLGIALAPLVLVERLLLGLRNQWSWALPAFFKARQLLQRGDVDLVYTTGGAYSAHLAGYWLKRFTGCRWIAEIHDPMVIPETAPRTRDARFQARLEGWICQHADRVWWFTDGALASARRRHPSLGERGFMVLPGANPPVHRVAYEHGPACVFGHFGSLSATRSLAPALHGLAALLRRRPALRPAVRVEVYGGDLDAEAQQVVDAEGLQDVVRPLGRLEFDPVTGQSGRERVLKRMQQVDVLLMMHGQVPECAEYIPSKLYDYLWAHRPVLAFTWRNPQLDALVMARGGFVAPTDRPEAIEAALEAAVDAWREDRLAPPTAGPLSVEEAVSTIVARSTFSS